MGEYGCDALSVLPCEKYVRVNKLESSYLFRPKRNTQRTKHTGRKCFCSFKVLQLQSLLPQSSVLSLLSAILIYSDGKNPTK